MPDVLSDVTVVIPTIGRPIIERCLSSIASGTTWPARLLVIDQRPSPLVERLISELRAQGMDAVHVQVPDERFAAAGRNRGFENTTTRFVAMTDDDCEVDSEWLDRMVTHLRAHPDVVVTGRVEPGAGAGVVPATSVSEAPAVYTRPRLKGGVLRSGNMGCSLALVRRVGPFDESAVVRSAEDNDWAYRAMRAGFPVHYAPDVVVTHLDWRTLDQVAATYHAYALSQGGFYGKYIRRFDAFIALCAAIDLARAFKRWMVGLVLRDTDRILHGRTFVRHLVPGIVAGLRAKPSVQPHLELQSDADGGSPVGPGGSAPSHLE